MTGAEFGLLSRPVRVEQLGMVGDRQAGALTHTHTPITHPPHTLRTHTFTLTLTHTQREREREQSRAEQTGREGKCPADRIAAVAARARTRQ